MSFHRPISRRQALRGLGTAIALPFLEAMAPKLALAETGRQARPSRMAFFYVPNGVVMEDWTPKSVGANFTLPPTLEPLVAFRQELLVLSGLTLDKARAH